MPENTYNIIYYANNYGFALHLFYYNNTILWKYIINFMNHSLHKGELLRTAKLQGPQIMAMSIL